ncbi:site-specific DNA-methyltransferase [Ottowia testudinis]|uniref:site-specific DNA-methyltransferase (adenine-specific) n=1 Tax=Ottowia testudinis TaxID=2816950 RepID=A0A975H750_9BURK|nr:site-specific DNA-methyltransferase [Ottowia testudinis]QTD46667.1 site-specific DNA-methyltransferase [Ottowia testudinis]
MTVVQPFFTAPSPAAQKLELLRALFPQAVATDEAGHITVSAVAIQQALDPTNPAGVRVEEDGYELRWAGKREAFHTAFVPPGKIVQPLPGDSKHWDSTHNLLIKGDNLDALRLLRQSYFGAVKLIYIDPPYNTQSDAFIYRDDFTQKQSQILTQLGYSKESAEYIQNIYGARTHSGWLSFMYPRLLLARDLLRDDGVIFISIDDHEQAQLKLLCDEVFGQENFVAQFVWEGANKNDARQIGIVHEYALVFARERNSLPREWSLKKEGVEAVLSEVARLKGLHHEDYKKASESLGSWFRAMKATPAFMLRRFRYIDARGAYKEDDPTAPGGRKFDLVNPITKKVIPLRRNRGWSFDQEEFEKMVGEGRISFVTENSIMVRRYLHETDSITPPSVHYQPARSASERLSRLMGGNVFDFPKDENVIGNFIEMATDADDRDCIVMDFFAGSGTTAHAVMLKNALDGGQRRFILVQIPEKIDAKKQKEAHGFVTETLGRPEATIFEITAERLRRAGAKVNAEKPDVDTGFRVFALADDPDALILQKPLAEATQADMLQFQERLTQPQPAQTAKIIYNLLLAEGLPLSTQVQALQEGALYRAGDVLLVLQALDTEALARVIREARSAGEPVQALSVYAPWVRDDNFLLGLKTLLETLDMSEDKLRLRG